MPAIRECEVLIVGAGPAGLATALYLLRRRPELAGRIVALEKACHPRSKVCAGGLIPKTMMALAELGLELEVPAVQVTNGMARTEVGAVEYPGGQVLCTIVRRDQFDARIARAAREAGLDIVENCRALEVHSRPDCVKVRTERGEFEAAVLVGADGSGSRVRRSVLGRGKESVGRALMADLPVDKAAVAEFTRGLFRFDFNCVSAGIKGYSWSFPCLIDGQPHLNVGIYDQCPRQAVSPDRPKRRLLDQLAAAFSDLPLSDLGKRAYDFRAFPIRWYDAAERFSVGRVLLAGDAAGVDPLMGEGISYAFEHGKLAADAIAAFLQGDGAALAGYNRVLHHGVVGRKLAKLAFAARHFYGPRHRLFFRLALLSRRAQQIGIGWYNGDQRLEQASVGRLVARWVSSVLFQRSPR